jgi:hypothetical protein
MSGGEWIGLRIDVHVTKDRAQASESSPLSRSGPRADVPRSTRWYKCKPPSSAISTISN